MDTPLHVCIKEQYHLKISYWQTNQRRPTDLTSLVGLINSSECVPYTRVSSSEIILTSRLELCVSRTTVKFAEIIKRRQLKLNKNVGFYIGLYCIGHHRERQDGRLPCL